MSKFSSVWVFSDTPSRLPELMGGAQHTGEQINVFVLSEADSEAAFHFGADRVWFLRGKPDDRMVEDYAEAMVETLHKHGGEAGMVLLPNTRRGKLLAAKLGYRLAAAVSNDASSVVPQAEGAAVKHGLRRAGDGRRDNNVALGGRHAKQRRFRTGTGGYGALRRGAERGVDSAGDSGDAYRDAGASEQPRRSG